MSYVRARFQRASACIALFAAGPAGVIHQTPPPPAAIVATPECVPDPCALNAASNFDRRLPRIGAAFRHIAALERSGSDLTATLRDPQNGIQTCVNSFMKDSGLSGTYAFHSRTLEMTDEPDFATVAHEAFHAHQSANIRNAGDGSVSSVYLRVENNMRDKDVIFLQLTLEATAFAFEFVVYKEADRTAQPGIYQKLREDFPVMAGKFDAAYDAAFEANAGKPAQARLDAALQAGGQAITDTLLKGNLGYWNNHYVTKYSKSFAAFAPIRAKYDAQLAATETRSDRRARAYRGAQERKTMLTAIGQVSPSINLIPARYFTKNARYAIDATLTGLDFPRNIETDQKAKTGYKPPPPQPLTCAPAMTLASHTRK